MNRPPGLPDLLRIGVLAAVLLPLATPLLAATYEVGPGRTYAAIGDVPWESLLPGDTVLIHWQAAPYREKWVIGRCGAAGAPVTVRGVPGPGGERPAIRGDGAVTRLALDYWNEDRSVLKVGGSSVPGEPMPSWIVIEGLSIGGARPPYTFTDDAGQVRPYIPNAAAIHVERGENVVIRDCELHDSGNGLFVSSSDAFVSRDLLVEGNWVHDNGNDGSIYEHNSYTAALGITFQFNRYGPLRAGCLGNNLKDRSAGLVVRGNWIEGGNRQLDLVDAEDSAVLRADPRYATTHVYGNALVETEGSGNRQVVHYGGDSGTTAAYRKGVLHFYNNTVVSTRTDRTTLMRLSTNEERCDARNNIYYAAAAPGSTLSLLDVSGVLDWRRNWIQPGWVVSFGAFSGTLNDDGTSIEGPAPGFVDTAGQDFHLAPGSPCEDAGVALDPSVLPDHDLLLQYVSHQGSEPRPLDPPLDLGAWESCVAPPPGLVTGLRFAADRVTLTWNAAPDAISWDLLRGDLIALRSGGDLAASVLGCLAEDAPAASASDPQAPPARGGYFYLVRATGACGVPGSWDSGGAAQAAPRDVSLAASPAACR